MVRCGSQFPELKNAFADILAIHSFVVSLLEVNMMEKKKNRFAKSNVNE